MKRMFSCSSSQVAVESWNKQDQKLLEAVEQGDVGRVATLATRKAARPAKLNALGQSAFHLAASKGLTECLTLLLAHGAPVNEKNDDGSTALHLATISCQPQCVKVLLQYGANEGHVDGHNRTPLHWAASSGCASSVLLLCDHHALLDATDAHGQTPLMLAAQGDHAAICAQLLQRGADANLADKDNKTALALACERGSLESAELLLSHGATVGDGDRDRWHPSGHTPNRAVWRLLRRARRAGRESGATRARGLAPGVRSWAEGTAGGDDEEEEEERSQGEGTLGANKEDEEAPGGCTAQREPLARRTRGCRELEAAGTGIRDLLQLLPGHEAGDGAEDEDGANLPLLAQHLRQPAEKEGGGKTGEHPKGHPGEHPEGHPKRHPEEHPEELEVAPFLAWLGKECGKLQAAKAGAFSRIRESGEELEEPLRLELEQLLRRCHDSHAQMLRRSRALLEQLEGKATTTEGSRILTGGSQIPAKPRGPAASGEEIPGGVERRELKENNTMLLAELRQLGRERERLREELRGLREGSHPGGSGSAASLRDLVAEREKTGKLRRRLSGQRRELAVLRDRVGEATSGDTGMLQELHLKLDGLVKSQQEALQLVAEMENDGETGNGELGELEVALGELVEILGEEEVAVGYSVAMGSRVATGAEVATGSEVATGAEVETGSRVATGSEVAMGAEVTTGSEVATGSRVSRLLERLVGVSATLRARAASRDAQQWREAAAQQQRVAEEALARAAERERETQHLQDLARELERDLGNLRAREGQLAAACRDKDGKLRKLLAETEKLSAEVLRLRGQSARLQLQLEVQQKNHRDTVAIYRTHLLHAAQGLMEEGVHAMLLQILSTQDPGAG